MKRFVCLLLVILNFVVFSGCQNGNKSYVKDINEVAEDTLTFKATNGMQLISFSREMTMEETAKCVSVGSSIFGVVGKLKDVEETEYHYLYEFELIEHIYGEPIEKKLVVEYVKDVELEMGHSYLVLAKDDPYYARKDNLDIYESVHSFIIDLTTLDYAYCGVMEIFIKEGADASDIVTFIKKMETEYGHLQY